MVRSVQPSIAMDSDSLPPLQPSNSLPTAFSDEQLMDQPRSLAVSNCRRAHAPAATSRPQPERTPRDDVVATGTSTPTSKGTCRSDDAQPPLPVHGDYHDASGSAFGPRGLAYTPVPLSRNLGPSVHDLSLQTLPAEIVIHILGYLDVCDLLPTSRACRYLRSLCADPVLHQYRLRRTRFTLPPLLAMHNRLSLEDLITRSIFLTHTSVVSRKLARSLVSIRLSRRLAARPSPEALVQRAVLPPECVPGMATVHVVPGLVAKRRAIEKERVKDGLRRWIAAKWRGEVQVREERARCRDEVRGVGRVWRLTRFWEQVGREEQRLAMR
ncbi:F-box domain-containing [Cordyceps militaris]|uniref:F-box domain-containing n=1 Tax=Cordyceps militaris TaxID=73501 RepID=A0A2H4SND4_CORMI|nr:F-box domain-containing [Cordyceps militaris]